MLQAAIFDMDGLMIDTEPIWDRTWVPVLADMGVTDVPRDSLQVMIDMSRGAGIDQMRRALDGQLGVGRVSAEEFRRRQVACFNRLCEEGVPAKPGLGELLAFLRREGIRSAVASSSPRDMIDAQLRRVGARDMVDLLVSAEEVEHGKPAPDVFLEAARRLGTKPGRSLVLEDSLNGIEAGWRGGFLPVMVPDLIAPDDAAREHAVAICRDLNEVRDLIAAGRLG
jgi:HAD superfamily hydrolase (TIGR01509 family)